MRLRSKLTYANVAATIALFLVLTGVGFAIARGGRIGTRQLKNGAVTRAKIHRGAVGRSQLANGAVGTGKISNSAVTTSKIATGAVTRQKIDNGSLPLLSTLNTGQTLRGMFDVGGTAPSAAEATFDGTTFQFPLVNAPSAPQANVLDLVANPSATTASCPGVAGGNQQTPNAAAGQLCIYITGKTHLDSTTPVAIVNPSRLGFGLKATSDGTANQYEATGFWAVTAP